MDKETKKMLAEVHRALYDAGYQIGQVDAQGDPHVFAALNDLRTATYTLYAVVETLAKEKTA